MTIVLVFTGCLIGFIAGFVAAVLVSDWAIADNDDMAGMG